MKIKKRTGACARFSPVKVGAFGPELPKPEERPVIPYALRDCEETETFLRRLPQLIA